MTGGEGGKVKETKQQKDKRIEMVLFRCPSCGNLTMMSLDEILNDAELECVSCKITMVQV